MFANKNQFKGTANLSMHASLCCLRTAHARRPMDGWTNERHHGIPKPLPSSLETRALAPGTHRTAHPQSSLTRAGDPGACMSCSVTSFKGLNYPLIISDHSPNINGGWGGGPIGELRSRIFSFFPANVSVPFFSFFRCGVGGGAVTMRGVVRMGLGL